MKIGEEVAIEIRAGRSQELCIREAYDKWDANYATTTNAWVSLKGPLIHLVALLPFPGVNVATRITCWFTREVSLVMQDATDPPNVPGRKHPCQASVDVWLLALMKVGPPPYVKNMQSKLEPQ